jgi:integrase
MKTKRERNLKKVGDRWYFDFSKDGKRYIRLGGRTKEEAKDAMAKLRGEVRDGPKESPADVEDPFFEDFAKEYVGVYAKPNKRSWERDERSIKHLNKTFGRRRLSQVSLLQVEKYRVGRLALVSLATTNRELACLKGILSKAVDWEKLPSFPLRKIKINLRDEKRRTRVLADEEESRLLNAASPHLKPMILLALHTGLRQGEILKMRAEHVNLTARFITVPRENSKSKKERRVPMNSEVVSLLTPLIKADSFVFRKTNGCPYRDIHEGFKSACRRAKKDPKDELDPGIEDLIFHDLRHTFEQRGLDLGMSPANMMEIQGHSSIPFSLHHYFHGRDEKKLTDVELLVPMTAKDERKGERLPH